MQQRLAAQSDCLLLCSFVIAHLFWRVFISSPCVLLKCLYKMARKELLHEAPCLLEDLIPKIMNLCDEAWTTKNIAEAKDQMKKSRLHAWDRQSAVYDIRHLRIPRRMPPFDDATTSDSEGDEAY